MKLSAKVKLATVAGLAAVIGIGGGGALYHHASQLEPVAVRQAEGTRSANRYAMDPSTEISSTTYANGTVGQFFNE